MNIQRHSRFADNASFGGLAASRSGNGFGRALDAEAGEVDVRFRIFIPSPAILMEVPVLSDRAFSGDGRGFSYDAGTSRADLHAGVRLRQQGRPAIAMHRREWGESHEWNVADTVAVSGKPSWWRDLVSGARPTDSDRLAASSSNLDLTIGGTLTDNVEVSMTDATVVSFMADGGLPLASVSPNINADMRLHIKVEGGRLKAKLIGSHDGFPAYEVYVARQRIYGYDPAAAGADPISLMPPQDVDVDTGWIDVGASTFSVQASWGPGNARVQSLASGQPRLLGGLPLVAAGAMGAPARELGGPLAIAELGISAVTAPGTSRGSTAISSLATSIGQRPNAAPTACPTGARRGLSKCSDRWKLRRATRCRRAFPSRSRVTATISPTSRSRRRAISTTPGCGTWRSPESSTRARNRTPADRPPRSPRCGSSSPSTSPARSTTA
jgi:hypothetical protein